MYEYFYFRRGLNLTELSLAYSPQSPVLEDVIRTAVVNLFAQNLNDLISIIIQQEPDIPVEIPPDIDISNIHDFAKKFVRLTAYNRSSEMRAIYSDEQEIRKVVAAVEFDDSLLGLFIICFCYDFSNKLL